MNNFIADEPFVYLVGDEYGIVKEIYFIEGLDIDEREIMLCCDEQIC